MNEENPMSIEEAKRVAVLKDDAPAGLILAALDALYLEVRRLENERDAR